MNPEIKIETGIPVPTDRRRSKLKLPFDQLKVSESFFVPVIGEKEQRKIVTRAANYTYTHEGFKFVCRRIAKPIEGVRVWRVECIVNLAHPSPTREKSH